MQQSLQITFRNIDRSEILEQRVREKMEKLDRVYYNIIHGEVVISLVQNNHQQGNLHQVSIHLSVPGHSFNVTRHPNESLYVALQGAIDNIRDQLDEYHRRLYGETKDHGEKLAGKIARLVEDEEYGFITDREDNEYYFNLGHLVNKHFYQLRLGDQVHFMPAMGNEGMQARRISVRKI